jgi:hypothetical protein
MGPACRRRAECSDSGDITSASASSYMRWMQQVEQQRSRRTFLIHLDARRRDGCSNAKRRLKTKS